MMYDAYDSDSDFFSNEITFLLEQKDRNSIIYIIEKKHKKELMEKYFPINNKRNDLLIWNVVFIREKIGRAHV